MTEKTEINKRRLKYQIKEVEKIIVIKKKLGKPTGYEEELVKSWQGYL